MISLTDIGGLAKQARADLRALSPHAEKGGDLDRCGSRAHTAGAQRRVDNADRHGRGLPPVSQRVVCKPEVDVDHLVLLRIEANMPQWLKRREGIVVFA